MTPRSTVILTRPRPASDRVAEALGQVAPVIVSPATRIVGTGAKVDLAPFRGVILTSANAVSFLPDLSGIPVYCVGRRTAEASGGEVRLVARDADDLVRRLEAEGPLLHAHGVETRGDVAERLNKHGIETVSCAVYRQDPVALTPEARAAIEGDAPVILPLWSPRSAARLAEQVDRVGTGVHVIALSSAVAEVWVGQWDGSPEVCSQPDGDEMLARIVAAAGG